MKSSNFYQISFGQDFFHQLALGMVKKFPQLGKDIIVLLPTKYACYSLTQKLEQLNIPLPSVYSINELDQLIKLAQIPLEKNELINKICLMLLDMELPNYKSLYGLTELAEYFADLLYKIELYQIKIDELVQILDDNLSLHKQQIGEIFKHFICKWKKNNHLTSVSYNNLLINKFSKELKDKSLIIAGLNSDSPAIMNLFEKAKNLDSISVVFYTDQIRNCENIAPSHPQFILKSICNKLNITSLRPWHDAASSNEFISKSLASNCSDWYSLDLNCDNIKLFSLIDQHQEAKTIIDIVSKNLDKKIMIVTADDDLMVKLMLHLKIQNISANIVRDYPLNICKTATWLQLCIELVLENHSLLTALALFKHSFSSIDPIMIELKLRDKNFFGKQIFALDLQELNKLKFPIKPASFKDHLNAHLQFAENIANQDIWQEAKELKTFLDKLMLQSEIEEKIGIAEYSQLLNHFLREAFYREDFSCANVSLLKPLDARLHSADLVILTSLNEGTWPSKASIDPGFSNNLLSKIGFPSHEHTISQEAHDFQSFANAPQVILTRAEKIESSVTNASRWALRMLTLSRNSIKKDYVLEEKNQVTNKINTPIIPPLKYRPSKLSATQVDKLIFNPYHIYVDLILKLKKLPPINKELSALDFGNFIHKALELSSKNNEPLIKSGKAALVALSLNNPSIQTLWWPRFLRIASWFENNENKDAEFFLESFGSIEINNFTITARADRIEKISSNLVDIIDYKTGTLPTKKSLANGKALQLIIEAIIAGKGGFCWQNNLTCNSNSLKYISLSGGENPAEILEVNLEDNDLLQTAEQYLNDLITQYKNPATPYHYSKKKTLGYCEYAHLSRNI